MLQGSQTSLQFYFHGRIEHVLDGSLAHRHMSSESAACLCTKPFRCRLELAALKFSAPEEPSPVASQILREETSCTFRTSIRVRYKSYSSASEASSNPSGRATHPEPELDTTSRSSSASRCLLWRRIGFSTRIQVSPAGTDTDLFHRHCLTSGFLCNSFNCKGFCRIWGRVPSDIALHGRGRLVRVSEEGSASVRRRSKASLLHEPARRSVGPPDRADHQTDVAEPKHPAVEWEALLGFGSQPELVESKTGRSRSVPGSQSRLLKTLPLGRLWQRAEVTSLSFCAQPLTSSPRSTFCCTIIAAQGRGRLVPVSGEGSASVRRRSKANLLHEPARRSVGPPDRADHQTDVAQPKHPAVEWEALLGFGSQPELVESKTGRSRSVPGSQSRLLKTSPFGRLRQRAEVTSTSHQLSKKHLLLQLHRDVLEQLLQPLRLSCEDSGMPAIPNKLKPPNRNKTTCCQCLSIRRGRCCRGRKLHFSSIFMVGSSMCLTGLWHKGICRPSQLLAFALSLFGAGLSSLH